MTEDVLDRTFFSSARRSRYVSYEGDYEAYVVEPREHRKLTKAQAFGKKERLEPLGTAHASMPGSARCAAHGLLRGGCYLQHAVDDIYCYYHRKISDGLLDPDVKAYPVWPLPRWGYRFA